MGLSFRSDNERILDSIKDLCSALKETQAEIRIIEQKYEALRRNVDLLLDLAGPEVRSGLKKKLVEDDETKAASALENVYRKFFADDPSALRNLAMAIGRLRHDAASGASGSHSNPATRFFSNFIANIANKINIADAEARAILDRITPAETYDSMSLNELMAEADRRRNRPDSLSFAPTVAADFYTRLWLLCSGPLRELSSETYEQTVAEMSPAQGVADIEEKLRHIVDVLAQGGVRIVAEADDETRNLFKDSADPSVAGQPLVYRPSDRYVYLYGISSRKQ